MSLIVPPTNTNQDDPVLSEDSLLPVRWNAELLSSLDWRRVVEIVRALGSFTGHALGHTYPHPDGSAEFTMRKNGNPPLLVRLAPWHRWMATADCLESFASALRQKKDTIGIYIAPYGFSTAALHAAARHGIQRTDSAMLAARLTELPDEHSEFYYDIVTAGDPCTPTCPFCFNRLTRKNEKVSEVLDLHQLPDVRYTSSDLVAESIVARRIEVLRDCEVHFLGQVLARDMVIHGVVKGNIVCHGSLLLNPGAVLYGTVAAKSVLVRPGAQLNGMTQIIQAVPGPIERTAGAWSWRCEHQKGLEACATVSFLPH